MIKLAISTSPLFIFHHPPILVSLTLMYFIQQRDDICVSPALRKSEVTWKRNLGQTAYIDDKWVRGEDRQRKFLPKAKKVEAN